ncbi:hypothetical protein HH310_10860 [Actinoplanes sp. TBRC 11911]|uniref:hypothetical protein n=1 Tax=Actinoplanes sp. TBRC 11911 TaxID=2729386 RepID=UPI00145F3419|nr:hypothetical protein [Actinoplanes sp. TBRC 11911]NMO51689.1 hypothetical protein [Actinoplanes sp. TBRC 11911]
MVNRLRGTLECLTDDEKRPLRPIGMGVREAAARTGDLLVRLADIPGVRLLAGVRVTRRTPPIGFVLVTATHVLLIESVAWPSGAYTTTSQGAILCDGVDIGQSVHPLAGAVHRMRRLARRRVVSAAVVVHPSDSGRPSLPVTHPGGPIWLSPGEVRSHIARHLRGKTYRHTDIISWYAFGSPLNQKDGRHAADLAVT